MTITTATAPAHPAHPTDHPAQGRTAWVLDAACAGQYELFDTAAALPANASATRVRAHDRALTAARGICHTCPVRRACEVASMGVYEGFMAELTEAERDTRWYATRATAAAAKTDDQEV